MDTKKYIYAPERDEHHRLFAVSLFNCSLMPPNEKQIGQRDMLLLLTSLETQVGNFLVHRMKFIPHISVVHNLFGGQ